MITFIILILIVKLFNDRQLIRGFVGDVIVISLLYYLINMFYDFNAIKLATITLFVAFTTEFVQYLRLTTFFGLEHNTIANLILGSVFDPFDLVAYTIGAVLVYIIDARLVRRAFFQ